MSRFIKEAEDITPNLIPIMNLFTALIPFLLMSAVFFRISVIQISVPVQSTTGETDVAKKEDKITLNLQIFEDRYELSASSDTLETEALKKLETTVPRPKADDQEPALEELSRAAYQIKGDYIASDTTIVVPEDDIRYEDVVAAMDAVRSIRVEREGALAKIALFPRVVLSSRIK